MFIINTSKYLIFFSILLLESCLGMSPSNEKLRGSHRKLELPECMQIDTEISCRTLDWKDCSMLNVPKDECGDMPLVFKFKYCNNYPVPILIDEISKVQVKDTWQENLWSTSLASDKCRSRTDIIVFNTCQHITASMFIKAKFSKSSWECKSNHFYFQKISRATNKPTPLPSVSPTKSPTMLPSAQPSGIPSMYPSKEPTMLPSQFPSGIPSIYPSKEPTMIPSQFPSTQPTYTKVPSVTPTKSPTMLPSTEPSKTPSMYPSIQPTKEPTTSAPSNTPSLSSSPTKEPSQVPSVTPSKTPTTLPSKTPSNEPSQLPSIYPSRQPTNVPSMNPSRQPTKVPSNNPSTIPSPSPTFHPSTVPTQSPSMTPSESPTISTKSFQFILDLQSIGNILDTEDIALYESALYQFLTTDGECSIKDEVSDIQILGVRVVSQTVEKKKSGLQVMTEVIMRPTTSQEKIFRNAKKAVSNCLQLKYMDLRDQLQSINGLQAPTSTGRNTSSVGIILKLILLISPTFFL